MSPPHHPLSKLSLLLLPLLLTPVAGLAATETLTPRGNDKPLRLLDESELPAEQGPRASAGGRIAAEAGLGLLTGAAGAFVGGLILGPPICSSTPSLEDCINGYLLGGTLGATLGASLGVWWGGSLTGGDGSYVAALLGGLVGASAPVALYLTRTQGFLIYVGMVLPLIGAVIGYELSVSPEPVALALGNTRLQPLLSVSPKGSFVGLGGHF